ncbi:putative Peptidase M19, renal dipeptidase family [Vibrio nigripulchritudo SFn27]|uniref:Putative Peptidase M19, renal dipeptidase family n=1 Tax=Vibrio nigripulchritudo TaxID=28173 RepID=U4K405_9VIBR|nr:membrane dipeptidase [Vibrio nigripulchritudo]CCN80596.1 putative Peptidase M19, renal dipeptidase family [Vibrio nigripulchritudo BLFn1]CCN90591.1 putative Peptidase M19, renal dipeptidase family [Vibrio nigripulchritudo SFn27]CCN93472.1 putative Peptidase M19, renal dipeptidase family [Vibrio nigripulchritudo ENn2]CCO41864.1 putative Peptidase M19, renal dipeptidase family [Vibrio nigripulchritudo SFn135]CCO52024.1 putative Peptidase M19, renal dipeptidase family [Vibrio nigripulchritudo 
MYQERIVIDGLQYCNWDREYFQTLKASGITAVHATLVYHENTRETLTRFAEWNRLFELNADLIMPVHTMADVEKAKSSGKVGVLFGAQNCSPIEDEIGLIEVMKRQGLLIMQLTYNNQSLLATGCYEQHDPGITRFGKQAIKEMNRVGMIIDMSHSAERSTLEAIDLSERPICISHANPSFAHKALRNKSDHVIQSLTERGGLLGFSLYPFHLPNGSDCTLDDFCQMIAKTADLAGVDHLAIGSDLCLNQPQSVLEWMRNGRWSKAMDYGEGSASNAGWPDALPWFEGSEGMENIYNGLMRHGFTEPEAGKILGDNWFQFLKEGLEPMT